MPQPRDSAPPSQPSAWRGRLDAFISYNQAADGRLARAIERGLQRFGKPWYSRTDLEVFRDDTNLAVTPDLWADIEEALSKSGSFILLASPESAQSPWVKKEVEFWLQNRAGRPLLIVLTQGNIVWAVNDFDWQKTNALPRCLEHAFETEPLWAKLPRDYSEFQLSLQYHPFFVEIGKLVAGVEQKTFKEVFDDAALAYKKSRRLLWGAAAALLLVTIVSLAAASVSFRLAAERNKEAARQKSLIELREQEEKLEKEKARKERAAARLAAKAANLLYEDRELSMLLALEAVKIAETPEAEDALRQTLLELADPLVLRGHSGRVYHAEFTSDGKRILTSSSDGTVGWWDSMTGSNLMTLQVCNPRNSSGGAVGISSLDGSKILTMVVPDSLTEGSWKTSTPLRLYGTNGNLLATITDQYAVRAALSPDNSVIATAGFDTSVKVWDAGTGTNRFELKGHESRVSCICFNSNGNWLLTGSWDGTARIWDPRAGRALGVLQAGKIVDAAGFSPDGKIITLSGDRGDEPRYVQLWDWNKTDAISPVTLDHDSLINDLAIGPDGKWLVIASTNTARIYDTTGNYLVLSGHTGLVNGVATSPNGKWVVTVSDDSTGKIWHTATGKELIPLGWNYSGRTCVDFCSDGIRIVTGTYNGDVPIYTYEICGSVQDLQRMAAGRHLRELTAEERREYLKGP